MNLRRFLKRWRSTAVAAATPAPAPPGISNPGPRMIAGKVIPTYGCELNVVDHCNLACSDCNHASPVSNKRWVDPETVYRDFSTLAKVFQPQQVKVLGGEPLLHPNLLGVMAALKATRIADDILLVTNGVLLQRMGEAFWQAVEHMEISLYPGPTLDHDTLAGLRAKARAYGIRLETVEFGEFRRTFSLPGYQQSDSMRRVYRACKIAHVWGCHVIQDGYFYKCPQSIYIPQLLRWPPDSQTADGIQISDDPGFPERLHRYLTCPEPLRSCRHCLDSHGSRRPITQVRRNDWLAQHDEPAEALLDYERLRANEAEMGVIRPDDIRTRVDEFST